MLEKVKKMVDKVKKKDSFLDLLRTDAMKLKFNNSLKVCANLV